MSAGRRAARALDGDGQARRRAPRHGRAGRGALQAHPRRGAVLARRRSTRSRSRPSATRTSRPWPRCSSGATAVAPDDATRLNVLQKLGSIYSDRLHDHAKAMSAWRRVLAIQPGHAKALRVLRDSLLAVGDYDGPDAALRPDQRLGGAGRRPVGRRRQGDRPAAQGRPELPLRAHLRRADRRARAGVPRRTSGCCRCVPTTPAPRRRARAALREGREVGPAAGALRDPCSGTRRTSTRSSRCSTSSCRSRGHQLQDRASAFAWARKAYELAPEREGALAAFEGAARAAGQWAGSSRRSTRASRRSRRRPSRPRGRARARRRRRRTETGTRERRAAGARSCAAPARPSSPRSTRARWGASTRPSPTYRRPGRGGRERRARGPDARPHPARGRPAGRPAVALRPAGRAREHRAQARAARRVGHPRGGGVRLARARGGALPADARGRAASRRRAARARPAPAGARATRRAPSRCIALDRDQREGAERAAREIELAQLLRRPAAQVRRRAGGVRAGARALAERRRARSRSSSSCCRCPRRARARPASSSSAYDADGRAAGARPRCSRSSSRRRRLATTAWRSTAASPTCTRPSSATRRRRST